jgi:Ner family transcriptional regulator
MALKNWHRADIVAAVHRRGTNLTQLARANNRADSTLRAALSDPRLPSNKIIAAFLGKQLHEIWPAWFDSQGRQIARKSSSSLNRRSSQKSSKKLILTGGRA